MGEFVHLLRSIRSLLHKMSQSYVLAEYNYNEFKKMSDSKHGSKDNLNESNMPLLEDDGVEKSGETPEKEVLEMEMEEKKDDSAEKEDKKEEKKKKVKKEPGPSCIDTMSAGLDLNTRDGNSINDEINLDFDDVLAEPLAAHGFDPIWRLAFILFTNTKVWLYKIVSGVIAIPMAILWGLIFSIITILYVWLLRPLLRIIELFLAIFKKFLVSLMGATVAPVCEAIGGLFSKIHPTPNPV